MKVLIRAATLLALLLTATAAFAEKAAPSYPFSAAEDSDGARYVWFIFGKSGAGYPYSPASEFPANDFFREIPPEEAGAGIVVWWPNYTAIYSMNKTDKPEMLTALKAYKPGELEADFGRPRYFKYVGVEKSGRDPDADTLNRAQELLDRFSLHAESYPPSFETREQMESVVRQWEQARLEFETLVKSYPDAYDLRLAAGIFYRYGHNLDAGGFDESRENLYRAIRLSPWSPEPYLELGTLLVSSDPAMAKHAETLFNEALKVDDSPETARRALGGLYFAAYFQGQPEYSLEYAEEYLKRWPGNGQMERLRDIAREVMESGRGGQGGEKKPAGEGGSAPGAEGNPSAPTGLPQK